MRITIYITLALSTFVCCFVGCLNDASSPQATQAKNEATKMVFEKDKWLEQDGDHYVYRDKMLSDVVYNDTIRSLRKGELTQLLGKPDYIKQEHYYYIIDQDKLFAATLHQKTMVVKFAEDSIEWIKIHE